MTLSAVLLALISAIQAAPTPTPLPQDETTVEDVIVDGGTLEQQARRFVDEVARPVAGRGLARWQDPVCVGVVNFRAETARVIADTVATQAGDLGVTIAGNPCEPNLLIVGAEDGSEMANAWVDRRPQDFEWNVSGTHDRSSALTRFQTSDDPVRWWQISLPMYHDVLTGVAQRVGRIPGEVDPATGEPDYPRLRVYARSQMRGRTRDDLLRSVVIVDVGKAERLTVQQLCDYLTMIAFAQVDPEADMTAYPTILNVFDRPGSVPGLTDWDRAYLSALYDADETVRLNLNQQASGIADNLQARATADRTAEHQ